MIMANGRNNNVLLDNNFVSNDDDDGPLIMNSCYYDIDEFNEFCKSYENDSNIAVLNLNARSLIKHFNELNVILESLSVSYDVITVDETWLDRTLEPLVQLDGYSFITKHKSKCKNGGGVGIYVKNNIDFMERTDLDCDKGYDDFFYL